MDTTAKILNSFPFLIVTEDKDMASDVEDIRAVLKNQDARDWKKIKHHLGVIHNSEVVRILMRKFLASIPHNSRKRLPVPAEVPSQ